MIKIGKLNANRIKLRPLLTVHVRELLCVELEGSQSTLKLGKKKKQHLQNQSINLHVINFFNVQHPWTKIHYKVLVESFCL